MVGREEEDLVRSEIAHARDPEILGKFRVFGIRCGTDACKPDRHHPREGRPVGTFLVNTNLEKADVAEALFYNAFFEPDTLPPVEKIARAEGLDTLR